MPGPLTDEIPGNLLFNRSESWADLRHWLFLFASVLRLLILVELTEFLRLLIIPIEDQALCLTPGWELLWLDSKSEKELDRAVRACCARRWAMRLRDGSAIPQS